MSLMQRSTGSSCCSRPCQQRPLPPCRPVRSSHLRATPHVHSSRTSRVRVTNGLPMDKIGIEDIDVRALITGVASETISGLLGDRATLQAALLKAPLQLIGGVGICMYAFWNLSGFVGLCGRLSPATVPAEVVAVLVLLNAFWAVARALWIPLFEYRWWKDEEERCVKLWDSGVVDHGPQLFGLTSRRSNVPAPSNQPEAPVLDPKDCVGVEIRIRMNLLEKLSEIRRSLNDAITWGVLKLVGAFALYISVTNKSDPLYMACLASSSPGSWAICFLVVLFQIPISAIGEVVNTFVKLKIQECICVAWCGKESIKPSYPIAFIYKRTTTV